MAAKTDFYDEQNFNHHFRELEEMADMLREITTVEKMRAWILDWQSATDIDGNHDRHNFPIVMDVSITMDDTGIWVEKNMFLNKLRKIAIQVF
jgi:hypothetical protein